MLLRLSLCAALALALSGCVTEDLRGPSAVGGGSNENGAIERGELAIDAEGLISAPVTLIKSPTTIVINQREEAKREIRFYGVSAPDKDKYPEVYAEALGWLLNFVGKQYRVYVRPLPGSDLTQHVINAQVMIDAEGGGRLSVTQAMLSLGLLIYNRPEEVPLNAIHLGFRNKQKEAYDKRIGVWKYERGTPKVD